MRKIFNYIKTKRVVLLFLSAFLIRLFALNQSLWLDEATTAMNIKTYSFWNIITKFSLLDFHPPLYYLVMKIWTSLFGYSEIALRLPSVLFSLVTGWIIYRTGQIFNIDSKIINHKSNFSLNHDIGFWGAAFFLFNPLIIYYSQEARMYMMVTFLVATNFYYFLRLREFRVFGESGNTSHSYRREEKFWDRFWFFLTIPIMFYTFYASVFYIATIFFYLIYKKQFRLFTSCFLLFSLSVIVISPLLYQQFLNSRQTLGLVPNWSSVLGNVSLKNLLLFPIKFTSGRISFDPKWMYYLLAGGWVGVVWVLGLFGGYRERKLIFFLFMPLLFGIIFSLFSPLLQYFRFIYLIVFMSVLLARSIYSFDTLFAHAVTTSNVAGALKGPTALIRKKMSSLISPKIIGIFLLLGFSFWSLLYLLTPQFHREDWKSLASILKRENLTVYMIPSSSDPLKYYAKDLNIRPLTEINLHEPKVVVLAYTADIHGVDYVSQLKRLNFRYESGQSFRGLSYEVWSKK